MTKIQFPVISGKTYNVQIAGRNDQKYTSAYSTVQNITIAGSTTPPSAPTSLTSSSDPLAITLF